MFATSEDVVKYIMLNLHTKYHICAINLRRSHSPDKHHYITMQCYASVAYVITPCLSIHLSVCPSPCNLQGGQAYLHARNVLKALHVIRNTFYFICKSNLYVTVVQKSQCW